MSQAGRSGCPINLTLEQLGDRWSLIVIRDVMFGNRRTYGEADVRRLRFIRHARELGFEIEDIRALLDLAGHPDRPCGEADAIARKHLADIDDRIARLTGLRQEVQAMVEQCSGGHVRECRIIEVLADHGECLHERH